jgi:hypothetical protein
MRPLLTLFAALFVVAAAASLDVAAQQSTPPSTPMPSAEPAAPAVAKATKKRRTAHARHRRTRYASLRNRMYSPCEIIDGWRAFPTRDRNGYFDTSPVCRRY